MKQCCSFHSFVGVGPLGKLKCLLRQTRPYRIYTRIYRHFTAIDLSQVDDIEIDGIRSWDSPKFCDAFIASATYKGREMTERELDRLNEDSGFVHEQVMKRLY